MKRELSLIQKKLLKMMKWFDHFCREYELKYYILAGTMLGAARHQGFIPWDDDIDVGMPRNDYEKLSELINKDVLSQYILETPESDDKIFCYPYSKIYDTTTTLIENKRIPLKRGIFIDVFPLDGIGNNKIESQNNFSIIKRKSDFYLARMCGLRKERDLHKNLIALIVQMIPEFVIDNKKLRMNINKLCTRFDFDETEWVGNLLGNWGFKETMPREIIGKPTEYLFEDIKVYGVENYNVYLTRLYGEWKKLPPKNKQVTHHDFIKCNLNKSYLNNKTNTG